MDTSKNSSQQLLDLAAEHHRAGRFREAERLYLKIVSTDRQNAAAIHYLGVLAAQSGRYAVAAELIRRAVAINPENALAHFNLGNVLRDQGCTDDAIRAYRNALEIKPDLFEAYNNLGNFYRETGQIDAAVNAFRKGVGLRPDCAWMHSNLIYSLHFHPEYDAGSIAEEHRNWDRRHAHGLSSSLVPHRNDSDPDRRLRIGYVSPDFRDHVVGRNVLPLLREHDSSRFEIFCYAHVGSPDAMTAQFQKFGHVWRDISGISDEQAANLVREDQIDILVDLTLHMASNRILIFARHPAPVQVTFAGYPGSTGLHAMDYRISDPYLDPPGEHEGSLSEKTLRLPCSFWCYDPLDCRDIPVGLLPALAAGNVTFGCLNNFAKVNDQILLIWARVLVQLPGSNLVLFAREGRHRQRTIDTLSKAGIAPSRVEFIKQQPRLQYMEQYNRIDVSLDTYPYNGHTTSLESMWMGVPVVTLVGTTPVSRGGWSELSNLGLTELAGHSEDEFVRIAVDLATDIPRLRQLRSTLRGRLESSSLMNAKLFTQGIEELYRRIWREWCRG